MYYGIDMKKFRQDFDSIKLAYSIGVFSKEYAKNKFRNLYAQTFGVCTGIYREMCLGDWEEPFLD